jgi:hypothetical protein
MFKRAVFDNILKQIENRKNLEDTEAAFCQAMTLSLVAGVFVLLLLDGGLFSVPGPYFFFPFTGYMFTRYMFGLILGKFPELKYPGKFLITTSPFWGFFIYMVISSCLRGLR